ncbi:PilW family protein [Polaromonas sp. DSR2-3-2]|uniref:PilW family protein n=1 Tax=unclassified Polaromonas TaxID=2638319 RepID=UPI003CF6C2C9
MKCNTAAPEQRQYQRGLTLIELMISMVLGLVIVGGVLSIFVSTSQTAKVNDNLMRIQENARTAFDLMARDLREAGQNPCGSKSVANVLRSSGAIPVWADWNSGTLRGYDNTQDETGIKAFGTTTNARVSGTDAVLVMRADQDEKTIDIHDIATTLITLTSASGFQENDIALVCDSLSSAIFQLYDASPHSGAGKGKNLDHKADVTNMNCSNFLGATPPFATCPTVAKKFAPTPATPEPGFVAKLYSSFWYIGKSESGQRSLYRSTITRSGTGGKTIIMSPDEMIPGVQDLQITYLTRNGTTGILASDWVAATAVTNWPDDNATAQVVAVRIDLTLQTTDNVSTSQTPIQRHLIHVVGLRNRDTFIEPPPPP